GVELTGTKWPCGLTIILPGVSYHSFALDQRPARPVCDPVSGGDSGGETPVPIPNTAVKPSSADGTARSPCGRVGRRRIYSKQGPGSPGVGGRALCVLASRARLERGRAAR